jgi:hypothetical protein
MSNKSTSTTLQSYEINKPHEPNDDLRLGGRRDFVMKAGSLGLVRSLQLLGAGGLGLLSRSNAQSQTADNRLVSPYDKQAAYPGWGNIGTVGGKNIFGFKDSWTLEVTASLPKSYYRDLYFVYSLDGVVRRGICFSTYFSKGYGLLYSLEIFDNCTVAFSSLAASENVNTLVYYLPVATFNMTAVKEIAQRRRKLAPANDIPKKLGLDRNIHKIVETFSLAGTTAFIAATFKYYESDGTLGEALRISFTYGKQFGQTAVQTAPFTIASAELITQFTALWSKLTSLQTLAIAYGVPGGTLIALGIWLIVTSFFDENWDIKSDNHISTIATAASSLIVGGGVSTGLAFSKFAEYAEACRAVVNFLKPHVTEFVV